MPSVVTHPSRQDLHAYVLGKLPAIQAEAVERHLADCAQCAQLLIEAPDDTLVQLARAAATISVSAEGADNEPAPIPRELRNHPRYRVLGVLGHGGMGTVFRAEHLLMARPVALKVINRKLTQNPQAIERFRREVRAAARLVHPHIVTAYDAEQAGELHFLVMEYVDGMSLDRLVAQRGPLTPPQACNLMRHAALGLAAAHEKGMVHRDIKPQNLIISRKGQLKILDFGLSRITHEKNVSGDGAASDDSSRTSAGSVFGTPDYIAPEQAVDASTADIRADIYSLGCTFYYLLTGGPPFPGGSALDKLQAHRQRQPEALSVRRPDAPREVIALVERMLAKDPAQRFQTPAELAQALAAIQKSAKVSESEAQAPLAFSLSTAPKLPQNSAPPVAAAVRLPSPVVRRAIVLSAAALVLVAGLWMAFGGNEGKQPQPGPTPPLASAKRVLFVIPSTGVWYPDYGPVKDALEAAGVVVRTAAVTKGRCELLHNPNVTKTAPPVIAELAITDPNLRASDYDAVIFSGFQINPYINAASPAHGAVAKLLRESREQGRIVSAICVGQAVLAQHRILDGLPAAGGEFLRKNFPYDVPGGPAWNDRPVQIAAGGRIITGRDHDAAPAFANELLRQLAAPAP